MARLEVIMSCMFADTRISTLVFFFLMKPTPPRSTLFPYTTLFRSVPADRIIILTGPFLTDQVAAQVPQVPDRKSTRLYSSHGSISYAGFCLKKKNITIPGLHRATTDAPCRCVSPPNHL